MDELITMALETNQVNFLTVIPEQLLEQREKRFIRWIKKMQSDYLWRPTLEGFRENFRNFIPRKSNLPIELLFENTISDLRSFYFETQLSNLIEQNRLKDLPEMSGIYEFTQQIQKELAIISPKIIDMSLLDRGMYTTGIKRLSWHIPMLDEATNGWVASDYMLITGQMNQGKSMVLKTMAMLGYENGENVLIVSQELPTLEMAAAMDGFVSGFSPVIFRQEDRQKDLDEKLKVAREHMSKNDNKIFIAPGISSVNQLQEYIWMIPEIDKVFIDGINLMGASNATTSDESYQGLTNTSRAIKNICRDQQTSVFGVTQQNRQGEVGGAYTLLQDPDVVFKVHGADDRRGRRGIVWENEKNRHNTRPRIHNFFMHVDFHSSDVYFYPLANDDIDEGDVYLGNSSAQIKTVGASSTIGGIHHETAMETIKYAQEEFLEE